MLRPAITAVTVLLLAVPASAQSVSSNESKPYRVKYVAADTVYIDGGAASGLAEGFRLIVKRPSPGESAAAAKNYAELVVMSVASTSAACEIKSSEGKIEPGDLVLLSYEATELLAVLRSSKEAEGFAQVVMFTGADPLDEELRESVPKPPLPEINRVQGRIAFDYDSIHDLASGARSHQEGVVIRVDMTRIASTHWSLNGYWRGRLSARRAAPSQQTLTDVMNRVYQIGLRYESPESRYVAGFGRLMLPWAASISTFDGGYAGRKVGKGALLGLFAGSTPDPTAWNYDPNREIAGAFVNNDRGSFDGWHWSSTLGAAATRLRWKPERQFGFLENGIVFKRYFSFSHNVEADYLSKGRFSSAEKVALTRSFATVRVQPVSRVSLNASHNYFRVLPTFDSRLLSTGLLDNLLFQGLSGGVRVELPFRVAVYSDAGRSRGSSDQKRSWNTMYGATLARMPFIGLRIDARRSRFSSSVGTGNYDSVSVVRDFTDRLRFEAMAGTQTFQSLSASDSRTRFVTATADWLIGRHAILGFGGARYRGGSQSYDQFTGNLGYRF